MKTVRDTPKEVINILIKKADIHPECSILEPSAGNGAILEALALDYKQWHSFDVTAVELNDDKFRHINGKLKNDLLARTFKSYQAFHSDFLKYNIPAGTGYDRVIAAPPFKDNIDLAHIKHMYNLLNEKGILVSLTTPYWMTNNEEHQVKFRKWLADKKYSITMLPDMTFVEKGKTVPTAIIKIYK